MKHYEVNFVGGLIKVVMANDIPKRRGLHLWTVVLLTLDATTQSNKLVPFGRIHINLNNVTFIRET